MSESGTDRRSISDVTSLERAVLIVPVAILAAGLIRSYAGWRGERVA